MKRKGMTQERLKQAVELCWNGRQTGQQIAQTLGIGRRTLCRWRSKPAFNALYQAHMNAWRDAHPVKTWAEYAAEERAAKADRRNLAQNGTESSKNR